jgi:hypothetical protein
VNISGIEAAKDVFAVLVADNENILFTYPFLAGDYILYMTILQL